MVNPIPRRPYLIVTCCTIWTENPLELDIKMFWKSMLFPSIKMIYPPVVEFEYGNNQN
jgi:hypothetical protein